MRTTHHFKFTTDISIDVNMPFNVNAFQGDQNVVDVLDSGCQNGCGNAAGALDSDFKIGMIARSRSTLGSATYR
ncbi:MAG: hypothetical protein J0M26_02045 [Planctomycetes bacterium]|nr:hypothetical protein [Planctomycetota bacterium]